MDSPAREPCPWFEQLWTDVCALRIRYRLPLRAGWWEGQLQIETLTALGRMGPPVRLQRWDDPPGKLALLYDLERIAGLLRDGSEPFHRDRDWLAFARHLIEIGCRPPDSC